MCQVLLYRNKIGGSYDADDVYTKTYQCVHVHACNIHDTKGGVYTLEKALYHYPTLIGVCADQGYRGTFKNTFEIFHNIKVDISPQIKNEFEIQPVR